MASSHAGQYKWEESQKTKIKFLIKTKWNGCTFSFGHSIGLHRSSFIKWQEAVENIAFQLPTEHTPVGYLIDNIQNNDTNIRDYTAITCINMNGMRDDFETTVSFLLPVGPYLNQSNNSNKNAQISDVNIKGKFQSKTGIRRINTRS